MSKSNATEIIALLWFILASQQNNHLLLFLTLFMGGENVIESIFWAFKEHSTEPSSSAPEGRE